jgi:hypothetical protein
MSKVFLCGDTHGLYDIHKLDLFARFGGKELTKNDMVIVLGDFGIWSSKSDNETLKRVHGGYPWTTLFADGNHDNHDLIENFPEVEMFDSHVGKFSDDIYHLKRGNIYTINGELGPVTMFVMGGGYSIDKDWRTPGISWWPQEIPSEEQFERGMANLRERNGYVDLVLTHSPPRRVIEYMEQDGSTNIPNLSAKVGFLDTCSLGLDWLLEEGNLRFDSWHFGHMHVDNGYRINGQNFVGHYNGTPCRVV